MNDLIHINFYSTLKRFTPEPDKPYPIVPGMSIKDVLISLHVPLEDIKLIFVDGKKAGIDTELRGGERIGIFPPIGGG